MVSSTGIALPDLVGDACDRRFVCLSVLLLLSTFFASMRPQTHSDFPNLAIVLNVLLCHLMIYCLGRVLRRVQDAFARFGGGVRDVLRILLGMC